MKTQNSFSHLTLDERRIILVGITNGSTKAAIAQTSPCFRRGAIIAAICFASCTVRLTPSLESIKVVR